jgi:hypothetical protein
LLAVAAILALWPSQAVAQRMAPATWGSPEPANSDPDAPPRRTTLPQAGDTLDFTTSVPDYPASAGWTLKYRLVPRTSDCTCPAERIFRRSYRWQR